MPDEKQSVVIELIADATQFLSGAKEALSSVEAAASSTGQKLQSVFDPALERGDQFRLMLRIATDAMQQLGVTGADAMRIAAQYLGQTKKETEEWYQAFLKTKEGAELAGPAAVKAAKDAESATSKATTATSSWGKALQTINSIARGLLVGIGLGSLLQAIRGFIQLIGEAVKAAEEFSVADFRLTVGVRAAQREFGLAAGSIDEWRGFIQDLRKQFQIFSTSDLTAATAKVILLTRELGFTKDQMQEVTKASIVLAEVSGRDVEDAARRLALFLDTGYARGLAQLGVQISKSQVEQYALAQGIERTWNEMSRAERASLSLAAVMQQVNRLMDDAGQMANTLRGQFMLLRAAQADAMIGIGENAAFVYLAWERVKTYFITDLVPTLTGSIERLIRFLNEGMASFVGLAVAAVGMLSEVRAQAGDILKGDTTLQQVLGEGWEWGRDAREGMLEWFEGYWFPKGSLSDLTAEEMGAMAESMLEPTESAEITKDAIESFVRSVQSALQQAEQAAEDMKVNMQRDFEDLALSLERDFADAFTDMIRDLEKIEIDYNRKRSDLIADAAERDREALAEGTDRRAELLAEYRLRELQAQREFNLEMAQLEREYLLSLEDAVRERDARAVLMLMRKHNLEVRERTEDFEEERRQRKENLDLELAQLKQSEARKRQEIRKSLNQQLADLQRDFYRRSQDRYRQYLQEREDLLLKNERERQDLVTEYARRESDLKRHLANRLLLLAKSFAQEYKITRDFIAAIAPTLSQLTSLYAGVLHAGLLSGYKPEPTPLTKTVSIGGFKKLGFAEGGAAIARQPTTAMFGEAGPELATFIPLDKMKDFFSGGLGDMGGQRTALDITVDASPDLVVRVIDQTMGEVANVIAKAGER